MLDEAALKVLFSSPRVDSRAGAGTIYSIDVVWEAFIVVVGGFSRVRAADLGCAPIYIS